MTAAASYRINEIFYSIQGEGVRAGTPAVFVRFSKCNLNCAVATHGFDCDTEFESGERLSLQEIASRIYSEREPACAGGRRAGWTWLILTGGEPALQVDERFCTYFHELGFKLAIETNGSIALPSPIGLPAAWRETILEKEYLAEALRYFHFDWITVSPKVPEADLQQLWAHEVKYVLAAGQALPETRVQALHQLVSPAFRGAEVDRAALGHCCDLVMRNPTTWRLSVQQHKSWGLR